MLKDLYLFFHHFSRGMQQHSATLLLLEAATTDLATRDAVIQDLNERERVLREEKERLASELETSSQVNEFVFGHKMEHSLCCLHIPFCC